MDLKFHKLFMDFEEWGVKHKARGTRMGLAKTLQSGSLGGIVKCEGGH